MSFDLMFGLLKDFVDAFSSVYEFVTTPLESLPTPGILVQILVKYTDLGDASLLSLFAGSAISVYIVYQLAIWLLNLPT